MQIDQVGFVLLRLLTSTIFQVLSKNLQSINVVDQSTSKFFLLIQLNSLLHLKLHS